MFVNFIGICWARGTFRNLLLLADDIFMKIYCKSSFFGVLKVLKRKKVIIIDSMFLWEFPTGNTNTLSIVSDNK